MNFTTSQTDIRTLKPGDKNFLIQGSLTVAQRAGFEISKDCPMEYQQIIQICINAQWLKPIAHVTERELLFMGLNNE